MSLVLDKQTTLTIDADYINIGSHKLTYNDFCIVVEYVMLSTDIRKRDDPREKLITFMRNLVKTEGFTQTEQRFTQRNGAITDIEFDALADTILNKKEC